MSSAAVKRILHPRALRSLVMDGQKKVRILAVGLAFAALLSVWYFISYGVFEEERRFLFPPPHAVLDEAFLDGSARSELIDGLLLTTQVALTGLAVAFLLGGIFGVLMSQARWLEWSFYPYAVLIQTIPILAMVPLIGFWFGFDLSSRVIVCVIVALFPIITNTLFGLKSADRGLHDVMTLRRASRWQRFIKLQLPSAAPSIFVGLRTSAGLSVIGAIVGGYIVSPRDEAGLGGLLRKYTYSIELEHVFGAVILSSALGLALFVAVGLMADVVVGSWHESGSKDAQRLDEPCGADQLAERP